MEGFFMNSPDRSPAFRHNKVSTYRRVLSYLRIAEKEKRWHQQQSIHSLYTSILGIIMVVGIFSWTTSRVYSQAEKNDEPAASISGIAAMPPTAATTSNRATTNNGATAECSTALPQIEWLGEGSANYSLGSEFDTFIVKRRPLRFDLEAGEVNSQGDTIYRATRNERVWRCQGNCQTIAIDSEPFLLGTVPVGTIFHLAVIDDDRLIEEGDERRNWWAVDEPLEPYKQIEEQAMVAYLSLQVPSSGTWYYYANDSMGIVATCQIDAEPTPTVTPTLTPTVIPTVATPIPTATSTATTIPTTTPTVLPTDEPTATTPPTATATATGTSTNESTATATSTATIIPTAVTTITPSATPSGSNSGTIVYVGSSSDGTVESVSYGYEDILLFDISTNRWVLYFDGSDVGLTADMSAFHLESDGSFLLSPFTPTTLPDIGAIDRGDIIRFTPTSVGEITSGTFSWVLDGSDVGFDAASETIDALAYTPDNRLVVSTYGRHDLPGPLSTVAGDSTDLIVFNATTLGVDSTGSWELYFDASDVGLIGNSENINDLWIDPATGHIYLTTFHNFAVDSVNTLSGDGNDIFVCVAQSLGTDTSCSFSPFWDGDTHGFSGGINTMSIGDTLPALNGEGNREEILRDEPIHVLYLPVVKR